MTDEQAEPVTLDSLARRVSQLEESLAELSAQFRKEEQRRTRRSSSFGG